MHVNENPPFHNEEIEQDIEENEEEEEVQAETISVPCIDLMLAQQIISFLKGLYGWGILSYVQENQAPTNPPVARITPDTGEVGVKSLSFVLCWVL